VTSLSLRVGASTTGRLAVSAQVPAAVQASLVLTAGSPSGGAS
jgi:hypothetical protein